MKEELQKKSADKSSSSNSPKQKKSSELDSQFTIVQAQQDSQSSPDQVETENEVFNQHKFEAFGLQLKEKNDKITPVEAERLGVLRAKMDDFWAQRLKGIRRLDDTSVNATPKIQAKLTIGEVGDKYEKEADKIATQVVKTINSPQTGQSVQQKPEEKEEGLQKKPLETIQREGEKPVAGSAPANFEGEINRAKGGGQPLAPDLQQKMGNAMGADFSGVKIHTDSQSDKLNRSIQAKAFTTGQDVFFRQGTYNPGSTSGQELIAHELTHVMQQNSGVAARKPDSESSTKPDLGTVVQRQVISPTPMSSPVIQRQLWSSEDLKREAQREKLGRFTFGEIAKLLDKYNEEEAGANRLTERLKIVDQLIDDTTGEIKIWMSSAYRYWNNPVWKERKKTPQAQTMFPEQERNKQNKQKEALEALKIQCQNERRKIKNEMDVLDDYHSSKAQNESNKNLPILSEDDESKIPDIRDVWSPDNYEKYVINAASSAGSITNQIHKVLELYHFDSVLLYQSSVREAMQLKAQLDNYSEENGVNLGAVEGYEELMEKVNIYRARIAKWSLDLEKLAVSWIQGHEQDQNRQDRYYAMLKFLASVQYARKRLDTDYPPLAEYPELELKNESDIIGGDINQLYGDDTNPEKLQQIQKIEAKNSKLSGKYEGSIDHCLNGLASLIDVAVPNFRDKSQIKAQFAIPVGVIGIISVTGLFKAENKEKGKLKVRGELSAGGGVSDPTGLLAKIAGELGGYIEAQGTNSQNVMKQISYGLYRRFRESAIIPHSITDFMWGGKKKGLTKYLAAEQWAADVETNVLGDTEKPDDVYVDTGGLLRLLAKGGDKKIGLEVAAEQQLNTGKRYNKDTITALAGGLGTIEKYKKVVSGEQKTRGKHYAMSFTEVKGNFNIPSTNEMIEGKYKHTREYSGATDREELDNLEGLMSKMMQGNLYKTKHEFNFVVQGQITSIIQLLAAPITKIAEELLERHKSKKELEKKENEQQEQEPQSQSQQQGNESKKKINKTKALGTGYDISSHIAAGVANACTGNQYANDIPEPGAALDIAIEHKWMKAKKGNVIHDIIKETKVEVDWRTFQRSEYDFGIGKVQGDKRVGLFGSISKMKYKEIPNPEEGGDSRSIPQAVYDIMKKEDQLEDSKIAEIVFAEDQTEYRQYEEQVEYEWKKTTEHLAQSVMQQNK